jgi:signal transduction histidine kinase
MVQVGDRIRFLAATFIAISVFFLPQQLRTDLPLAIRDDITIRFPLVFIPLFIAYAYNMLSSRWIPWKSFSERTFNSVALTYIGLDMLCICLIVYFTGGINSSYFYTYFLDIIWMCTFFRADEQVIALSCYILVYYLTASIGSYGDLSQLQIFLILLPRLGAFALVGWLAGKISAELTYQKNKLEKLVSDLPVGLVLLDDENSVTRVNPKAREFFGDRVETALDIPFDGENGAGGRANLRELIEKKSSTSERFEHLGRKSLRGLAALGGQVFRLIISGIRRADDTMEKLLIFDDITEQKQLEQLKQDYVSMLTHDLRNSVTVISLAHAQLPRLIQDSPKANELLWLMDFESRNMIRMIEDIADLSLIDKGKLELSCEEADIIELAENVVRSFALAAEEKGVALNMAHAEGLCRIMMIDTERMTRVFANLLHNAIKYSKKGGTVSVSLESPDDGASLPEDVRASLDTGKHYVLIHVADEGQGIAKKYQAHVFERYVRSGDNVNLRVRGTGLGLAICREMVEAHGGKIWLRSEAGRGAVFSFILPCSAQ